MSGDPPGRSSSGAPHEDTPLVTKRADQGYTDELPAASGGPAGSRLGLWMAYVLMIKSMIGCGWMSMPKAFSAAGVTGGVLTAVFVGWLTIYGLTLVTDLYLELTSRPEEPLDPERLSLQELAGITLGRAGRDLVLAMMLLSQLGVGVAFVVYLADYVHALAPAIPRWAGGLIFLPVVAGLCQLRSLDKLKQWSAVGVACVLLVIAFVVGYSTERISKEGPAHSTEPGLAGFLAFPECFGITFFSMEGIFCFIPIVQTMERPSEAPVCFVGAVTTAAGLYVMAGLAGTLSGAGGRSGWAGYLAWGDAVEAPVTDNLSNSLLCDLVRSIQAFAVLFTFPIQMLPVAQYCDSIVPDYKITSRLAIVVLVVTVAVAIPDMADILALVGKRPH